MKPDTIHVWTDGSSRGNPGPGGVGIVIVLPGGKTYGFGCPLGTVTNNQAELLAASIALEALAGCKAAHVVIHTDSQGVIGWLTGAWRVNANVELVEEIREQMEGFMSVSFVWVRGHEGEPNNETADRLARQASKNEKGDPFLKLPSQTLKTEEKVASYLTYKSYSPPPGPLSLRDGEKDFFIQRNLALGEIYFGRTKWWMLRPDPSGKKDRT